MDEDTRWLAQFERQFNMFAGNDRLIQLDEFKRVINVKESFFAERFFEIIDEDSSGSISQKEMLSALRLLFNGAPTEKLHLLFQVYDVDGNGSIDFDELQLVLRYCMAESALSLSEDTLAELTQILFDDADTDGNGKITFEELCEQLDRYPDIAANLSISAAEWLRPPTPSIPQKKSPIFIFKVFQFLRNNFTGVLFFFLFVTINMACGLWGVINSYNAAPQKYWLMLARATGRCLNFNCAFVLFLMLRKCLTWLRSTKFVAIFPVDQHVILHKMVGWVIVFGTCLHCIGHIANGVETVSAPNSTMTSLDYLFTTAADVGWLAGTAFISGWLITILLVIIVGFSFPCVRRNGYFQVFYWTHQLSVLFWAILIAHAPYFWAWFLVPGAMYFIERFLRLKLVRRVRNGQTFVKAAVPLPANVTLLVITRPSNFEFRAGEYVFINIPNIARHEWHPFTISSAPEQKGFITLHIRTVGNWTRGLASKAQILTARESNDDVCLNKIQGLDNPISNDCLIEEGTIADTCSEINMDQDTFSEVQTPRTVRQIVVENSGGLRESEDQMTPEFRAPSVNEANENVWIQNEYQVNDTKQTSNSENERHLLTKTNTLSTSSSEEQSKQRSDGRKSSAREGTANKSKRRSGKQRLRSAAKILPHDSGVETLENKEDNILETLMDASTPNVANNNNSSQIEPNFSVTKEGGTAIRNSCQGRKNSIYQKIRLRKMGVASGGRGVFHKRTTQHSLDIINNTRGTEGHHTGLEIIIDGPYGAPSQHIYEAEHAVLIGGGIGVTPFASILQSIHERYKLLKKSDPSCWSSSNISSMQPRCTLNLKKVDFFWINRHQKSFEWFLSLLNLIEIEQEAIDPSERFITMHLYMTSALRKNDVKAIGLYMALDLIHKKERRDMITGLMTRTQAGRPDWDQEFSELAKQQNYGRTTVFFCGSPQLGAVIRSKCNEYGFGFRKEYF